MKQSRAFKLLICVVALVLVFGVCTTAMATSRNKYNGSCNSNFFTSTTVSLGNATHCKDDNTSAVYAGLAGKTDYTSRFYFANKSTQASGVFYMSSGVEKERIISKTSSSGYKLKVSNSHSGYPLTVLGYYEVYAR